MPASSETDPLVAKAEPISLSQEPLIIFFYPCPAKGGGVTKQLGQCFLSSQGQPTTERHTSVLIPQHRLESFPHKAVLQALLHVTMLKEIVLQLCFIDYYVLSAPIIPGLWLSYPPTASSVVEESFPPSHF